MMVRTEAQVEDMQRMDREEEELYGTKESKAEQERKKRRDQERELWGSKDSSDSTERDVDEYFEQV